VHPMVQEEIPIGRFRLSLTRRELRCDGTQLQLSSRAIEILCELAAAKGGVVSKDDLMARVWHGVTVGENNIQVHISTLRRTLEKNADGQSWILTVPGRGYRLLLPTAPVATAKFVHEANLPVADRPSLAVLAFHNLSGDLAQQNFADGTIQEIITALSRIRWLLVTSTSTIACRDRSLDIRQIGRALGVRYVLDGSVRKSGGQVRITAQLTDTSSGAHMWVDRFDGPLNDVFDFQDKVASSIAGAIEPILQAAEAARSTGRPTTDLTACDLYLRAYATICSSARQIPEGLSLLGQAVVLDQRYSPALACAAFCHYRLVLDGRSEAPAIDQMKSIDFARRALEANRDDPDTLAYAAQALAYFGEDINAMIALVDRALALNPNFVRGWHSSADVRLNAGQLDLAIAHIETASRLNPRAQAGTSHTLMGAAHFLARRFNEAVPKLLLAIHEDPSAPVPYRYLAACYAHMKRTDEAREIVRRLSTVSSIAIPDASHLRNVEHRELFLSGLRLAVGADDGIEASPSSGPACESTRRLRRADERRQVTVLCCELVGNRSHSDGMELEDISKAAECFQHCVSEAANHHQGFVYRDLGNSALILFGYPDTHEHDAEQAVHAGLQLCASIRTQRTGEAANLHCRVGIATAMVLITHNVTMDAMVRRESIVCDPVTVAVRLAALAQLDAVAIGATTRRLIGDLFDCTALCTSDAPGNGQPTRIWQVLGESAVTSRFVALRGPVLTPLVGRDEEMDLLSRRWARAKMCEGQAVLISGEAGIGKSRIATELASRLDDEPHLCLRYFCSPYHQDSALFPFIDQLAQAAGFSREDSPAVRSLKLVSLLSREAPPLADVALLADVLTLPAPQGYRPPTLGPKQKMARILEALIRRLESLARRQPVLVIFEDAHWIDPTSRELLEMTLDSIRSLPVLLIVTLRPELQLPWAGQEQVSTLELNRLDRHNRTALVEQIVRGKALPDEVAVEIVERSDGVPLFVEELTKNVLEGGLLREDGNRYVLTRAAPRLAIPTSLQASLIARLDHLGSARQVAQIGAAIGRTFSYTLLRAVCPLPESDLHAALERLVVSQLVLQRGTLPDAIFTFKHALVQDAAHASLLHNTRQQLHAQIGEALETHSPELLDSQPELFAQHYAEAEMFEKSAACWARAGRGSVARSAIAEAAAQFQKGLEQLALMPEHPNRRRQELKFYSSLGAVLSAVRGYAAPETGRAYARARELWDQLGCPSDCLGVPYGQSTYHAQRDELDTAQRLAEDILRLSRIRNDPAGLFLGHFAAGRNLMFVGRFDSSRSHLEKALALSTAGAHSTIVHQAGLHPRVGTQAYLANVLFYLGYPNQALTQSEQSIVEATRLGHPPSLAVSLSVGTMLVSLLEDAPALAERALRLLAVATEQGFPHWRAVGMMFHGWTKVKMGDVAEGMSLLRSGLSAYRATGAELWVSRFVALLAATCEIAGKVEEAEGLLNDALEIVERTGECWFVAELKRHKGCLMFRQKRFEAAERLLCEALKIARAQKAKLWELRAAIGLAQLCCHQGRFAEARGFARRCMTR
jgi:TolB-like protein/class 3 adenylate cyclase/predicted ATPase